MSERVQLQAELERAERERERLDIVIDYLRERIGDEPAPAAAPNNGTHKEGRKPTAAKAAEQVLLEHGEPMRTPDILKAIQAMGATMKDADGLYKTLTRSDRFVRTGRGLWTLA